MSKERIIYTMTDEAPALATYSFLPVIKAFAKAANIDVETRDISLSARILAGFSDFLPSEQQVSDALAELGDLAKLPEANIIKLPNISASVPQLSAAINELKAQGYALPDYPENPVTEEEKAIKQRYDKVKGSAVNPVLREGNSDRRAPSAVKQYARSNPHSMGEWSSESQTHVASMSEGDFYASEQSATIPSECSVDIELHAKNGDIVTLKKNIELKSGEIIDAAVMSKTALRAFFVDQIEDAKASGLLLSLHMKATMMKVSDPIIFGHMVDIYYEAVYKKHAQLFDELGVDVRNGFGDLLTKMASLSHEKKAEIEQDIAAVYAKQPGLAMVNSDKGITNLHVPSDVIIDASMPAMIRASGQMWGSDGKQKDTKAVIPDRSYAGVYEEAIRFCKQNGALDPKTMGSVPNVGLMAQKAEEYGSHDKTFEIPTDGVVRVICNGKDTLLEHAVAKGDIWRMCQVKDEPIADWVKLAVSRARATGSPAVFWLDKKRAHDAALIAKVKAYLPQHDIEGLDIRIMSPVEATRFSLERIAEGKDTISVTGNVLRDYLTDLFPILELGTSAKMLSIVPLMNGGGLFETGAGGSAPKHVEQLLEEGHLRWDSLGEFLALAVSLEHLAKTSGNTQAQVLAETLDAATGKYLQNNKSPSRKVGEIDNRGSHFYVALYWAQALSKQDKDIALKEVFMPLAVRLGESESKIISQLGAAQGSGTDLGGYYKFDCEKANHVMRPSPEFNSAIDSF